MIVGMSYAVVGTKRTLCVQASKFSMESMECQHPAQLCAAVRSSKALMRGNWQCRSKRRTVQLDFQRFKYGRHLLYLDSNPFLLLLSIPSDDRQRLSYYPLKWLRFVTFTICGAPGDLLQSLNGPIVFYCSNAATAVFIQ
jgi:hypothetical protein